ncbi:diguanylate cyclase [Tolypothrix tenuis PCC 7101]|uniref:Diguanylate cyclase n=1 Tax=Tolypothrix tenuis PCC 7101 TaxID=231146 RepID=A0A1Z4MVC9_9CYAN|nr:GGDEF domain-containing protein [Aulosira sp. FACHB-113]BAY97428.1 diguanylate cyclase [Tolypothrix tenuis PCC 7101]BAZ72063.1 diguanylate cyclase [Aulosira laxa NIES-50]
MNISILVFGCHKFLNTLPDQIRYATAFNVEVIDNFDLAVSYIQSTPPDIIIVQASIDGSIEICTWLKDQVKLSWIYCILLEDRSQHIIERANYGWEWDLEMTSAALKQGADAYIWQVNTEPAIDNLPEVTANHRLILAQLSVGLRKAEKYRDLMRKNDLLSSIALADSLTELNNRRALEWDLPRQIQKAHEQQLSLSLIIFDVDFFKKVNDTYGHLVGDRLLQLLATRVKHNLRFQDTAFRYGGEEFVILLANTSGEEAAIVARRLNRIVSEQPFAINNQLSINVTISLGTASLQTDDDAQGISLLHRADQCLLEAKSSGRNRVISWENFCRIPYLQVASS